MSGKIVKTLLKGCVLGISAGAGAGAYFAHKLAMPRVYTLEQTKKYENDHGMRGDYNQLPHTNYTIKGQGGITLHCEYTEANHGSKKIVIITHGYTSNREGAVKYAVVYAKLGFNCLIYDCRGHGENERMACSVGYLEAQDLLNVIEDTYERYGEDIEIGLHGESMGAATSLIVLKYHPNVKFVVADCPFASLYDLMGGIYKKNNMRFMLNPVNIMMKLMYGFTMKDSCPREALQGNQVPICLIHGTADSFIPSKNSDEIAEATSGYNEIHKVNGAEHALSRMVLGEQKYAQIVWDFLKSVRKLEKES